LAHKIKKKTAQDKFRVAAAQMKFAPTIDENLTIIERLVDQASRDDVEAVLLPECATTGYGYDFPD
jgi:predicted amidohydrolase